MKKIFFCLVLSLIVFGCVSTESGSLVTGKATNPPIISGPRQVTEVAQNPSLVPQLELTIASLKDNYVVGENVGLTDPPIEFQQEILPVQNNLSETKLSDFPSTNNYAVKTGTLAIAHYDAFDSSETLSEFYLFVDEEEFKLDFPQEPSIEPGSTITVAGKLSGDTIAVDLFEVISGGVAGNPNNTLGEQKVAVILVSSQDSPQEPNSPSQVHEKVFNIQNIGSINYYINEVSYEKTFLSGDVYGWYVLPVSQQTMCNLFDLDDYVIAAADADVDFTQYSRIMIVFPDNPFCWFGGFGSVGSYYINTNDGQVVITSNAINGVANIDNGVGAHEFGHNFGVWHSNDLECQEASVGPHCQSIEYGDIYDIMGLISPKGHYNVMHKEMMNWLEPQHIVLADHFGLYTIEALELDSDQPKGIKIPVNESVFYYIEYRRPIGLDQGVGLSYGSMVYNGAVVTLSLFPWDQGYGDSQLIDNSPITSGESQEVDSRNVVLSVGQTFFDSFHNISFTVVSINDSQLQVFVGPYNCGNNVVNVGEQCDGQLLNSQTCQTIGFESGSLNCNSQCRFDASNCVGEICSVGHDYDGVSCTADFLSSAYDSGVWAYGYHSDWNPIRNQLNGYAISNDRSWIRVAATSDTSYYSYDERTGFSFDTSSIPDSAVIDSAELIFVKSGTELHDSHPASNDFVTVVKVTPANPPFLVTQDFDQFDSINNPLELSDRFDLSENYHQVSAIEFDLNPAGIESINKQGYSVFGLRTGYDLFPENPNNSEFTELRFFLRPAEYVFSEPKLIVNYRNPGKSQVKNLSNQSVTGLLSMKVQKKVGAQWVDVQSILSNSSKIIPANGVLALDLIWNPIGFTAMQSGDFRVYAEFKVGTRKWSDSYEFIVS